MKILYLITSLEKGGAERYLLDICARLRQIPGLDFIIATTYDENAYDAYTADFEIVNLEYSTFSLFKKNENVKYKQLLQNFSPDIIHTHRFLGEFISSYYINPNIKYVCHGHDNMVQFENFKFSTLFNKRKLLNYLEKYYLCRTKYFKVPTWILANSKDTYNYYKKVMPRVVADRVELLYCGFDYDRFFVKRTKSEENAKIKILNVSSFAPKKNQIFIVDIAKELRKRNVDFEIKLIGNGENYLLVENAIHDNNLQEYVKLCGLQMKVEDFYKDSDIYLHSAYYEPFGLVLLEAMAAGLPIVTLDGKGNRDLIQQDINGCMIYEQDSSIFAEKIIEIYSDRQKYESISKNAQEFAKQFDIKVHVDKLLAFYKEILN